MQRLLPEPASELTDEEFREAYEFPADRPWVRASFVVSLDGATVGPDGSSRSIASASDQRVFSMLRLRGDVVLVGAGTLRDEGYGPSRRPTAVVTRSLSLSPDLPLFADGTASTPRTLIFSTDTAAHHAPAWLRECADIVPCGSPEVDLRVVIAELANRGFGRIHCEGGPTLLRDLAVAGLVDELAVSVSPLIVGAPSSHHLVDLPSGFVDPSRWRVTQVLEEDGTVFLLLRRPS